MYSYKRKTTWVLWTPALSRGNYGVTEIIDEKQVQYVKYCNDCYQYFERHCKCKVPKVVIKSTGEVV